MINLKSFLDELTDEQIDNIKKKFLTPEIKAFLEREEYSTTFACLFECGLNVSEASKKAYMHRNTLNYRLNKFKSITGIDLHNLEDALMLKLLIEVNQYTRL